MNTYKVRNDGEYQIFVDNITDGMKDRMPQSGQCLRAVQEELENINLKINLEWVQSFHDDFGLEEILTVQTAKEFVLWMAISDAIENDYCNNKE